MKRRVAFAVTLAVCLVSQSHSWAAEPPSDRRLAFALGRKVAHVALLNGNGQPDEVVKRNLEMAETLALHFGGTVPALPAQTRDPAKDLPAALHYVLEDTLALEAKAETTCGKPCGALFRMAARSHMFILYVPGDTIAEKVAKGLLKLAPVAGLPEALIQPLAKLVLAKAPANQVLEQLKLFAAGVSKALGE